MLRVPKRQVEFWAVRLSDGHQSWAKIWGPIRYYEIEKHLKRNNGAFEPGAKVENGARLLGRFRTKEEAYAAAVELGFSNVS